MSTCLTCRRPWIQLLATRTKQTSIKKKSQLQYDTCYQGKAHVSCEHRMVFCMPILSYISFASLCLPACTKCWVSPQHYIKPGIVSCCDFSTWEVEAEGWGVKKKIIGSGEMAQQLKALAALPEELFWLPAPTWWVTTVCSSVLGDAVHSSGFCRHQAGAWCTDIHTGETPNSGVTFCTLLTNWHTVAIK